MATVTPAEIRAWVATWVEATAGGYAFRESPRLLGVDAEASSVAHQSFSVLLDQEEELGQMRQRSAGTHVRQHVRVKLAWRLRPGADQLGDYDDALDAAHAIARQMTQRPTTGALPIHVMYDGIPSRVAFDSGKFVLIDVAFLIDHLLDLSAVV